MVEGVDNTLSECVGVDETNVTQSNIVTSKEYETLKKQIEERIEQLKKKESEDTELNIKIGTEELNKWRKERKERIEQHTNKILESLNTDDIPDRNKPFDWNKTVNYIESSAYFNNDRNSPATQKLIELILKKNELTRNNA